ncbi:MAG TPA: serine/threonine-protein kinase [Kofleriaceae bacterium]
MGEVPTKRGQGGLEVRNALEDTIKADPSTIDHPGEHAGPPGMPAREVIPSHPPTATTSLPSAERYRLGAELGRGGMGRVVEAFDLQLGRTVALKEVLPRGGPSIAKRFVREVQLTARLEHPSIVPLYDAGTTIDGRPFYVMRRVSGRPLDQLMAQATGLVERLILLPALLAAVDAVGHAHRRGVIHRDLKPANILVGDLGETVVIDWGLAKVIGEDDDKTGQLIAQASDSLRTQIGSVFGTPGFMAPEQARGEELDPRGDVYALGAILYQLLAGTPPHAGASATEVIVNTGSREVTPVDVKAPGAPVDLVAIVGKALAFDAANRYPDAGALGEDLRRFLTGQLVAAHHYTRRQHLARFARRHRAPLSVAALAMVAVAVLAWVGVHRIVQERNAAQRARALADTRAGEVARANADLQKRTDQLIVSEARTLLDRNPTHAAAVLKDIPDASARIAEARAIAQAAYMRGLAWTMPLPDVLTIYAELSRDGKFLLQVGRDNQLRVWDLDRRALVVARPYRTDVHAIWAGKQIFVTRRDAAPELVDPFTGAIQAFGTAPVSEASATTAGDRIAYIDAHGAAVLADVATRTPVALWPGHTASTLEVAPDGSWVAVADKAMVAVVDPTGRELTSRPIARALRIVGSRFGSLVVQAGVQVVMCALPAGAPPTWTELDVQPFGGIPIDAEFRGRELDTFMTNGKVVAWNGTKLFERTVLDGFAFRMVEAAGELLIVPGTDGQLHFSSDLISGSLHLPVPLDVLKVYASPGASRVVAIGKGVLVGFDLDALPRTLSAPTGINATLVDDDTVLLWRIDGLDWQWVDVRTGKTTPFEYDVHGLVDLLDIDPTDGRVLSREQGAKSTLYMLRKHTKEHRVLVSGAHTWGRLLPRDALIFGVGDGRIFGVQGTVNAGQPGAPQPRQIAKLDGFVDAATGFGDTGFAAVSTAGELVRGDLATGALARARITAGSSTAIAAERAGRVLVAEDGRLLAWDQDVVEIARLEQRIDRIVPLELNGGHVALLELADHSIVRVALNPGARPVIMVAASSQSPLISGDGKLIVSQSVNNQLMAVELVSPSGQATQAQWELPVYYAATGLMSIAPSSRRFLQAGYGKLALWSLPLAPTELHGWLDERTNAVTDDNHTLAWSWQTTGPARPMSSPVRPAGP